MPADKRYETLFNTLQSIANSEPDKVPQLLAIILAGGPFRPFLEKPELLNKAVVMAKNYLSEKKRKKAAAPQAMGPSPSKAAPKPAAGRVMSLRDMVPPSGPSKA
jgi:hypothetical protein